MENIIWWWETHDNESIFEQYQENHAEEEIQIEDVIEWAYNIYNK